MNKLYFLIGLPASGKSTWAENNKEKLNFTIHSSDVIRTELLHDINDQSQNELVFNTLHKRIKEDLLNGKNVCYDSTGLKRKNRLHFLREIKDIPCEKICVLFATPIISCRKNNRNRERNVPEEVITRMYKSFEVPCKQEGWNDIQIVWWDWKKDGLKFYFVDDMEKWKSISHDNPHHSLSIGNHMIRAGMHMCEKSNDYLLHVATCMHDCGKIITKAKIDSKGNPCETAHYYEHHNVGSYISLFYLKDMFHNETTKFKDDEILYISLLIGLHMRPFLAWKDSDKAKEKDRILFGDKIIKSIELLHKCDKLAH